MPLRTVTVLDDKGTIGAGKTRWMPRKVDCSYLSNSKKAQHSVFVVKYRRCKASSAVSISELACYNLLKFIGIKTFDAALIYITPERASWLKQNSLVDYDIYPGLHYGSLFRSDIDPAHLDIGLPPIDQMADPDELIHLWAADTWLVNSDRGQLGNVQLSSGKGGKFHLIAADQSDCFHGANYLSDGNYVDACRSFRAANVPMVNAAIHRNPGSLEKITSRIIEAQLRVSDFLRDIPAVWWQDSGVNRDELAQVLIERASNIRTLVNMDVWNEESIRNATEGGIILE